REEVVCFARMTNLEGRVATELVASGVPDPLEAFVDRTPHEYAGPNPSEAQAKRRKQEARARAEVLVREHDCSGFTEWEQGFTPKEHREKLDRLMLRAREDDRDRSARCWRKAEFVAVLISL